MKAISIDGLDRNLDPNTARLELGVGSVGSVGSVGRYEDIEKTRNSPLS